MPTTIKTNKKTILTTPNSVLEIRKVSNVLSLSNKLMHIDLDALTIYINKRDQINSRSKLDELKYKLKQLEIAIDELFE